MQSVPITTNVASSNHTHGKVYLIQHYVIKCQWLATSQWFSQGTLVSSTNKTDRHNITEILLKVALNTITLTLILSLLQRQQNKRFGNFQYDTGINFKQASFQLNTVRYLFIGVFPMFTKSYNYIALFGMLCHFDSNSSLW